MSDESLICPHCGEENLPGATRCLHCGLPLDQAFAIDGVEDANDPLAGSFSAEGEKDLPDILRDLHNENLNAGQDMAHSQILPDSKQDEADANNLSQEPVDALETNETEGQIPDWLERVRRRAQTETDSSGDFIKKVSARDNVFSEGDQAQVEGELNDWLGQIRETARRDGRPEAPVMGEKEDDDEGDMPVWLKRLREREADEQVEHIEEDNQGTEEEETLPAWLDEDQESGEPEDKRITDTDLTQPIKLTDEKMDLDDQDPSKLLQDTGEMQKIDTEPLLVEQLEDVSKQVHITTLREEALLKNLEESDEISTPPTWGLGEDSSNLFKDQISRMELLKALVAAEGKPVEAPKKPSKSKTGFIRFVLALLLIIPVSFLFLFADNSNVQKGSLPVGGQAMFESITKLAKDSKVLVVLDYHPGLSAEMAIVFGPVIRHLAQQQVEVFMITSVPEGVWISDQLILSHGLVGNDLNVPAQYLPGGRLGLLNYAVYGPNIQGLGFIKPFTQAGIQSISDFDSILVLVDSLDGGQIWLEQVGPYLNDTPILMISSTQEAVMLLPYLDSGQLDGLLSGLHEANLYEAATGAGSQSGAIWRAYQAGLLIMAALILVSFVLRLDADAGITKEDQE